MDFYLEVLQCYSRSVQLQEDFACCQPHFVKVLDKFRRIWAAAATHVILGSLEPAISFKGPAPVLSIHPVIRERHCICLTVRKTASLLAFLEQLDNPGCYVLHDAAGMNCLFSPGEYVCHVGRDFKETKWTLRRCELIENSLLSRCNSDGLNQA